MMMMMMPASSATVRVDKATSDLLMNPDWAMNMDICDYINSYPGQAREFVKAVKRRLQHRNPKVQYLALTLLETMVKNCGDYIHFQIAEKNIPAEMVKIVKKKADMHVRDKILGLLDAWQEAFGGPGGKHPQYYYAYEELRRSGIQFPRRSPDAVPIFTPPVTHPTLRLTQAGYGMPSNSSRRLDEAMATEIEGLSMLTIDSMRDVMNLLSDMLQAVNPRDRDAVKDEVIVDLVARCQANQRKLMQMLTTTGDEELLAQGLELNDNMQTVLAKHDAIASGSPLPSQITSLSSQPTEARGPDNKEKEVTKENGLFSKGSVARPSAPPVTIKKNIYDEEEEEEDDFAQLARRHAKSQPASAGPSMGGNASPEPTKPNQSPSASSPVAPSTCRALVLPEPPAPVKTSKEQDMIDLLSLALTTTSTSSPQTPQTPSSAQSTGAMSNDPYPSQTNSGAQGQFSYNSYVVPWAQPQNPPLQQPQPQQLRPRYPQSSSQQVQPQYVQTQQVRPQFPQSSSQQVQPQYAQTQQVQPQYPQSSSQQVQPQYAQTQQVRPQYPQSSSQQVQPQYAHTQIQPQQVRPQYPQSSPQQVQPQYAQSAPQRFIPPPWAATPGYLNSGSNNTFWTAPTGTNGSSMPLQETRPLQHLNSFPARGMNRPTAAPVDPRNGTPAGQKPFIPSYRLFEDLNVLGKSGTSSGLSGSTGQSMIGGRR